MKTWKRIILVIFVLIGGTMSFGYWSNVQLNQAFDNLGTSYLANTRSVFTENTELASPSLDIGLASSSLDTELAFSSLDTSEDVPEELAHSTGSGQAIPTDPELSFTFPQKDTEVYTDCTYQISWQPTAMISSLEAALIDAGAGEAIEPKTSGLAKENTIEKEAQNLNWKVGFVWPGAYYIKVSEINGAEAEFRSKIFKIKSMPKGFDEEEKINICQESSG